MLPDRHLAHEVDASVAAASRRSGDRTAASAEVTRRSSANLEGCATHQPDVAADGPPAADAPRRATSSSTSPRRRRALGGARPAPSARGLRQLLHSSIVDRDVRRGRSGRAPRPRRRTPRVPASPRRWIMSLTDRDRKIVLAIVPSAAGRGLLVPAARAQARGGRQGREELAKQEQRATSASAQATPARGRQDRLRSRLRGDRPPRQGGPVQVDMPSLIVQLDRAAQRHRHPASRVAAGEREAAARAAPRTAAAARPATAATPPTPAAQPAQSAPGRPPRGEQRRRHPATRPPPPRAASTPQTSTASEQAALPSAAARLRPARPPAAAGGARRASRACRSSFEFSGNFLDLADFFHRIKRFVQRGQRDGRRARPPDHHRQRSSSRASRTSSRASRPR